jgi:hypothetical protein
MSEKTFTCSPIMTSPLNENTANTLPHSIFINYQGCGGPEKFLPTKVTKTLLHKPKSVIWPTSGIIENSSAIFAQKIQLWP